MICCMLMMHHLSLTQKPVAAGIHQLFVLCLQGFWADHQSGEDIDYGSGH